MQRAENFLLRSWREIAGLLQRHAVAASCTDQVVLELVDAIRMPHIPDVVVEIR